MVMLLMAKRIWKIIRSFNPNYVEGILNSTLFGYAEMHAFAKRDVE